MKHSILIALVSLLLLCMVSCKQKQLSAWKGPKMVETTLLLDVKPMAEPHSIVKLVSVVNYHGCYYCLFDVTKLLAFHNSDCFIFAIDKRTLEYDSVAIPPCYPGYLRQLEVHNDSLFILSSSDVDYYYDTLRHHWIEMNKTDQHDGSCYGFNHFPEQLCYFNIDDNSMSIFDIGRDDLRVLNIRHNMDSLPQLRQSGLDSFLQNIKSKWGRMTLKDAKGFEKQVGGTAAWNWPISRNGYFEDLGYHEGYHIVRYYKNVDTKYTLETEYCVNDKDGRVVAIFIEGRERIYYKRYDCCQNRETSEKLFREEVFSIMDSLCGPRCSKRGDCYWFSDTMTFRYDNKNNRLLVY